MKIFSKFLRTISSYNSSILLAALVSLLLVILFVLLLHFYARYFWSAADEARRRRRRRRRRVITRIPSSSVRGFLDNNTNNTDTLSTNGAGDGSCTKGLDSGVISSIPLFVYEDDEDDEEECVICLSMLEVGDVGRKLGQCGHKFHVECIDMWLASNSSCPLCRSSAVATLNIGLKPTINDNDDDDDGNNVNGAEEIRLQVFSGEGDDDNDRFVTGDDGSTPETGFDDDHESGSSSSSLSSSTFGCSLKRILSRSRSERKVLSSCSNNNSSSEPSNS